MAPRPRPRPLTRTQICCIFQKRFTPNGLLAHYGKKHPNNKIQCLLCCNLFEFQIDRDEHMLAVHGEDQAAPAAAAGTAVPE
ncbi:hypothetical protein Ddye_027940 [Dipteronia dyeriana]|uniref:Uncharacterized protein n=1 Tax=Dipteronia dyeriana TaxID=168575 RepID=A0AAD9TQ23_9ROSI|nr:hypothetical protein Ddye_027940 [Dipteronia dyeriana]